jgi:hypothetical protein
LGITSRDHAGQEITWVVSCASSTLEGGLACEDADPSHPASMDMAEGSSALEVAATEDPAPEGGAGCDPTLEGVGAGSPSVASLDVHVGSPLVQSDEAAVTHLSTALVGLVTLEASEPDSRSLPSANGAEVPPSQAFDIILAELPSSSNVSTLPALGLPLFLSNLQVSHLLLFYFSLWQTSFLLIFS